MLKISFAIKQKSLEQLQHYKQHYQQVYPHAKQKRKIVLQHYLKKLNKQIQKQENYSDINN